MALARTALDIVRKANKDGEVGYAEPLPGYEGETDWDAVQDALDRRYITYGYDASPGITAKYHGQIRTVYFVTELGRAALCSSEPVS